MKKRFTFMFRRKTTIDLHNFLHNILGNRPEDIIRLPQQTDEIFYIAAAIIVGHNPNAKSRTLIAWLYYRTVHPGADLADNSVACSQRRVAMFRSYPRLAQ